MQYEVRDTANQSLIPQEAVFYDEFLREKENPVSFYVKRPEVLWNPSTKCRPSVEGSCVGIALNNLLFGSGQLVTSFLNGFIGGLGVNGPGGPNFFSILGHYVGYQVDFSTYSPRILRQTVHIRNAVEPNGAIFSIKVKPNLLLVPAIKLYPNIDPEIDGGIGLPFGELNGIAPQGPGLVADYYLCYNAPYQKIKKKYFINDEFESRSYDVLQRTRLCNPVRVVMDGEQINEIINDGIENHFACYLVRPHRANYVRTFDDLAQDDDDDDDNSRVLRVNLDNLGGDDQELCVPTQKRLPCAEGTSCSANGSCPNTPNGACDSNNCCVSCNPESGETPCGFFGCCPAGFICAENGQGCVAD